MLFEVTSPLVIMYQKVIILLVAKTYSVLYSRRIALVRVGRRKRKIEIQS